MHYLFLDEPDQGTTMAALRANDDILRACEDERCELKAARSHFDFPKLADYCAALSNEGGGVLVLGVSDAPPRRVVGTHAFRSLQKTGADVTQQLRIKIAAVESSIDGKRVITFRVPAHPIGQPIAFNGGYLMRGGEGLVPMTTDQLKRIMDETVSDYSATLAKGATLDDLHPDAIGTLRDLWARRSGDPSVASLSDVQVMEDLGLTIDGEPTVAALVLLARPESLMRLLAQAEVVFEYRSQPSSLRYQQRREFRCKAELLLGLELDGVLLAWGTDLVREGDAWSNARDKRHACSAHVRDGAVIFVLPVAELDPTAAPLQGHGVKVFG